MIREQHEHDENQGRFAVQSWEVHISALFNHKAERVKAFSVEHYLCLSTHSFHLVLQPHFTKRVLRSEIQPELLGTVT